MHYIVEYFVLSPPQTTDLLDLEVAYGTQCKAFIPNEIKSRNSDIVFLLKFQKKCSFLQRE